MSPPVRMTVKWSVPRPESGPITSALNALMVAARVEPGCVSCNLSTQMGDKADLRYEEVWENEEHLKRQLRSIRFARLAELVERSTECPEIEFVLGSGVRGLDYAAGIRDSAEV